MSGVSARTLRYYDEISLLKPAKVASSGYRIYGQNEVNTLQQILLYRELGFPLNEIKTFLSDAGFNRDLAFAKHLAELTKKRERLDALIVNVTKSLASIKGEITMSDNEKFEGFKQSLIDENEKKYGAEIRHKYGDQMVDESNANLKGMTREQYEVSAQLSLEIESALKAAVGEGDPAGELAQKACDLHRQWLRIMHPKYNKEYHKGLGEMYVTDKRFKAYYDKIAPGCAEFFRDAIKVYCRE